MALTNFAPNAASLSLIGKGSLWLDLFDANEVATGTYMAFGTCSKFGITVKPTVKKLYNSLDHRAGLAVSAVSQIDVSIKIEGYEFGPEQVAIASMADVPTVVTQATATVSAEALASALVTKKGRAFQTLNREISAVVVLCGTATLVNNVDYVIKDAHLGLIYFPEGSSVVNTTAVTVSYSAAAIASTDGVKQLLGASVSKMRGKLLFVADPMKGPSYDIVVPRVSFASATEMDYIGTDFGKWQLDGDVEDNTAFDPTIPYYKQTRRA